MASGNTTLLWLDKTYEDTMDLLVEAKHYHSYAFQRHVDALLPLDRLDLTKESLRITSRLSHTMAWLMYERAILNNEMERSEVEEKHPPLSEEKICMNPSSQELSDCPKKLLSLMDRSLELFMRASRLEAMLRDKTETRSQRTHH